MALLEGAIGVLLGGGLACWGWRQRLLDGRAALVVACTVAITFIGASWVWGALWAVYLVTGGLWIRLGQMLKLELLDRWVVELRRNWLQMFAVTGWGLILVGLHRLAPGVENVFPAFVGAVATATADLWASELGVLSGQPPRRITSGRSAPHGTPGAVSLLGTVAAAGGAWLQGFVALLAQVLVAWVRNLPWDRGLLWLPLAATLGGLAGTMVDSLLGATAQAIYVCDECRQLSERPIHRCGRRAQQVRGWLWLSNDAVNLVSVIVGAAVTAGIAGWLARLGGWW